MSSVSAKVSSPSSDLSEFADAFQLIGLSIGEDAHFRPLVDFAQPEDVSRQLSHQANTQENMDTRTQGTYFISLISWSLAEVVSCLDLNSLDLASAWHKLTIQEKRVPVVDSGVTYHYVSYRWQLDTLATAHKQQDAVVIGQNFISCLTPFVEEVRIQTGMAKGALWRLVTDAIAASYLSTGKKIGQVRRSMDRVRAIINETGGVLANKNWHFKEYAVDAASSPTGQCITGWFRVRGGCCRYYTLSDGEYCSTCIHLSEGEREERLKAYLAHSAV